MSRQQFLNKMIQTAAPVLDAASSDQLRQTMAVEQINGHHRERYSGFEAVARLLGGMAPWLELDSGVITDAAERSMQQHMILQAQKSIAHQVHPSSRDFADYISHNAPFSQILVDTALLAQAILRAPRTLWDGLDDNTKDHVILLLEAARKITAHISNWLLFSVEVEILYFKLTGIMHHDKVTNYIRIVDSWYFGDGWYGDGPHFKTDYYNSLIIHPMLLDVCDYAPHCIDTDFAKHVLQRAQRHGEVLENLVAPDGTFIVTGRSKTYRCGSFHLLSMLAWQKRLPDTVSSSVVRELLFAITEKTLSPASYRNDGFLNIGVSKHQPELGEIYISTGSLYMAAAVFLPLGLAPHDVFWTSAPEDWTQKRLWAS